MFDANGKDCRVTARIEPALGLDKTWSVIFTPTSPSPSPSPFVAVLVPQQCLDEAGEDDDVPLWAVGTLYSDEKVVVIDDYGQVVCDSHDAVVYRPTLAVSDTFEGARLLAGTFEGARLLANSFEGARHLAGTQTVRVDCADVLPMWIECDLALTKE
jgi:hypothetical protein